MKQLLLISGLITSTLSYAQTGGVGIGTTMPDTNAALEIRSANKALIIPRLSTNAFAALTPKAGMIAYNFDTRNFMACTGGTAISISAYLSAVYLINPPAGDQVAQTYVAPSTFLLQDFGAYVASGSVSMTYILNVYAGTGNGGALLGTGTVNLPPGTGGMYYFNLINSNITLQSGSTYTFSLSPSVTNSQNYIVFSNTNVYSQGNMLYNNTIQYPNADLTFEVRAAGSGNWRKLIPDTMTTTGVILPSTGGTPSILNYYEETTFPVNFYNGTNIYASNYVLKAIRIGKQVTLTFPSDLNNLIISGVQVVVVGSIPNRFIPQTSLMVPMPIQSNGTVSVGIAHITSSGIGIYSGSLGAPFAGSNSGIRACSITYSVQ